MSAQREVLGSPRIRMTCPEALETRLLFATYTVDDNRVDRPNADFTTIQEAVVAAGPGDTIRVYPGNYNGPVDITEDNLKLRSERKWAAVITGGTDAVVEVDGAKGVEIRGFKIAGTGGTPQYGVLVSNGGSAEIRENWVTGENVGIAVLDSSADIRDNQIDNYGRSGVIVDALEAPARATVTQNTVTGTGGQATVAQNGIQVSSGAKAEVSKNVVSNNIFVAGGGATAAIGIFLASAGGGSAVSQNEVFNSDVNIAVDDTTSGVTVEKNRVTRALYDGISLARSQNVKVSQNTSEQNGGPGISLLESKRNVVEKNDSNRNGLDGISLFDSDDNLISQNKANDNKYDGIFVDVMSTGNRITQNSLFGNGKQTDEHDAHDDSAGSGTAGTANTWEKNKGQTENRPGLLEKGGKGNGNGHGQGHGNGHGHGHSKWNR